MRAESNWWLIIKFMVIPTGFRANQKVTFSMNILVASLPLLVWKKTSYDVRVISDINPLVMILISWLICRFSRLYLWLAVVLVNIVRSLRRRLILKSAGLTRKPLFKMRSQLKVVNTKIMYNNLYLISSGKTFTKICVNC